MPQIVVIADRPDGGDERAVMFTERVNVSDFESRHFQSQLVERLGWAVGDAAAVERTPAAIEYDRGPLPRQPALR
jgi:hypothetical protein